MEKILGPMKEGTLADRIEEIRIKVNEIIEFVNIMAEMDTNIQEDNGD